MSIISMIILTLLCILTSLQGTEQFSLFWLGIACYFYVFKPFNETILYTEKLNTETKNINKVTKLVKKDIKHREKFEKFLKEQADNMED